MTNQLTSSRSFHFSLARCCCNKLSRFIIIIITMRYDCDLFCSLLAADYYTQFAHQLLSVCLTAQVAGHLIGASAIFGSLATF